VAFGVLGAIGSYFGGDQLVLASSHAQEITAAQAPELYNVVNEMAVAAGVPMPKVYIIDDPSPNAFATGRDPQHSSVAITTGLLQKLTREELQGVIGHEMSHVRNYDIRFTMIVGVMVGSIALLAQLFLRYTFWFGGGRNRDNNGGGGGFGAIMLVVGIVMAILAPFFSALVTMAVSRQREYLADASSVQLTRNPHGLESALAKLASDNESLHSANGATQHLYIVNPLKKLGGGAALFSTHPPIVDRINRPGRSEVPVRQGVTPAAGTRPWRGPAPLPGATQPRPTRPPCSVSARRGTFQRADGQPVRQLHGPR
jgi:heat shock protein HtpX